MRNNQQLLGAGSILLSTILYGFFVVLSRIVGFNLPIFFQNWTRELVATIILVGIIYFSKQSLKRMTVRDFFWIWARALAGSAAFLMYFYCVNAMPVGTTYFLFYGASSLVGFILGSVLFNEKMTPTKWIAMLFAFLGLLLVYSISFRSMPILYILMALGSGTTTAFWEVVPKKVQTYPTTQFVLLDNLLPIPLYILLSLITHETWTMPAVTLVWAANIFYGILFVLTGQLVVYGFRRLEAQIGSILMLGEIPAAILFGYIFYKETVSPTTLLGGICIIAAVVIPELNMRIRKSKRYSRKK
jgi:drug/metabolite transporter, DME family